jgi:hypothetical protein
MVSPSPEPAKPTPIAIPTAATADPKKPACWTDKHEADLNALAARGEDAPSIIELMVADHPCLNGKLSEDWIKEQIKEVRVIE